MNLIEKLKLQFSKNSNVDSNAGASEIKGEYKEALDFESSLRYMIEKSNKRAYIFAFIAGFVCVLALLCVMLLTPLKTTEPYVIRVDNTTGAVDIITTLDEKEISRIEALDKNFINQYVRAREGYYYDMLNRDYELVQILSSESVASEYRKQFQGENAKDAIFKNNIQIGVDVLSIVLTESAGVNTATVRVNLKVKNQSSKSIINQYRIITLSYGYEKFKLQENLRTLNPLGFRVLTYRIDEDLRK